MDKKEKEQEIEFYQKISKLANSSIAKLQSQLAEAEKPKLRHWDYGYTDDGYARIVMEDREKDHLAQSGHLGMPEGGCYNKMSEDNVTGNLADDLKALAEPLEDFEIEEIAKVSISKSMQYLVIEDPNDKQHIDIPIACISTFILNLRRMLAWKLAQEATLKQKQ